MKVIIGNDPDNNRDLKVHTRSSSTGADGPDRVLQPGDYAEIEILEGDYLVGNPDAFREHTPSVDTSNAQPSTPVIIGGPTADAEDEAAKQDEAEVVQAAPAEPGPFLKTPDELAAEGATDTSTAPVGSGTISASGEDSLLGGQGADTLLGEDTINGGSGNDTLAGGQGADTFTGESTVTAADAAAAGAGSSGADAVNDPPELRDPTTEELQAVVADLMDDPPEEILTGQGLINVDHLNAKLAEKGFAPVSAAQRSEAQAAVTG